MSTQEGKQKVTIIDAMMGSGKTSFAKQWMRKESDTRNWLYVTQYITEVDKVIEECPEAYLKQPQNYNDTKANDFTSLLMRGQNIATTHVTFSTLTPEAIEYIRDGHYTLILDEVINVLEDFNDVSKKHLGSGDIKHLLNKQMIVKDNETEGTEIELTDDLKKEKEKIWHVKWNNEALEDWRYKDVEQLIRTDNFYLLDEKMLLWTFPYEVFQAFDEVLIFTYNFDWSWLKPYFTWHKIEYNLSGVEQLPNGEYTLCPYKSDKEDRPKYKSLIHIYDNPKANDYQNFSLSSRDMEKLLKDENRVDAIRRHIRNYFINVKKAKSKDILWTCKKEAQGTLQGKGYQGSKTESPKEKKAGLTIQQKKELEADRTCFLPLNARGYNEYRHKTVLAYIVNFYPNPMLIKFMELQNKLAGVDIQIDRDKMALSTMLQWIWRSAIRDGKPISIYIPSTRMRNLLIDWLDGKI